MTAPTFKPKGRPKGSLNRASRAIRERAAASGLLPHEFLLAVTRGELIDGYKPSFAERLDAAKASAPFYAPKLSSVEASVGLGNDFERMSDEELEALIRDEARALTPRKGGLQ